MRYIIVFIFRRKYKLIRVRGDVRPPKTDIFSKETFINENLAQGANEEMKAKYNNLNYLLMRPDETICI